MKNKVYCKDCRRYEHWMGVADIEFCNVSEDDYHSKGHVVTRDPRNLNIANDCPHFEEKVY